jgi:predicted DNA-binding transcriptional regulator AlpA
MTQQHCRLTLDEAIARYKNRLINAKGLLMFFFEIKLKPGWKGHWSIKELITELPMARSTIYRYLSELRSEKLITWEVPDSTRFTITHGTEIEDDREGDWKGEDWDKEPQVVEAESHAVKQPQPVMDKPAPEHPRPLAKKVPSVASQSQKPQPRPVASSDTSSGTSTNTSDSFQSFYNSLSDLEKSAFIRYVKDRTSAFPRPIANHMAWLASVDASGEPRYKELYVDFERSPKGQEIAKAKAKQMLTDELREQYAKEMEERENKGDVLPIFHKRLQASYGTPEYHIRMAYQIEWTAARDKREFLHDIKEYGLHRVIAVRGMEMASRVLQRSQEELSRLLRSEEPIHALP